MTNLTGLRDGRIFCTNPALEADPGKAKAIKKKFVVSLNPDTLSSDPCWNVGCLRDLCTGLMPSKCENRKLSKKEMIEIITEYILEDRVTQSVVQGQVVETLEEVGFDTDSLLKMISKLSGDQLASSIVKGMKSQGHAEVTTIKTVKPDIIKLIEENYTGLDKVFVIDRIHEPFRTGNAVLKENGKRKVNQNLDTRTPITIEPLLEWVLSLLEPEYIPTWKECSIALALVTGRRMAEIHGVDSKLVLDPNNSSKLIFTGQLKTRGRTDVAPRSIPVLIPVADALSLYNTLEHHGMTEYLPYEVNKKLAHPLSSQLPIPIKRLFKKCGVSMYKDLRCFYATCLQTICPKDVDSTRYLSLALGHGEFDTETSGTYRKFYLTDPEYLMGN